MKATSQTRQFNEIVFFLSVAGVVFVLFQVSSVLYAPCKLVKLCQIPPLCYFCYLGGCVEIL